MPARFVHVDFETTSAADLRKTGVYRYAEDQTTRVLCMAYSLEGDDPLLWLPGDPFPGDLLDAIQNHALIIAWNAAFERQIWKMATDKYGFPPIDDTQWRCTMVRAAYFGLPMSLDMASRVMGGPVKSKTGHALMMKMCKPRGTDPFGNHVWWDQDPVEGKRLVDELGMYCIDDVMAERGVGLRLPKMPDSEVKLWVVDQEINDRGVQVDFELVGRMSLLSLKAETKLNADMYDLTDGAAGSTGQIDKILKWLEARGVALPNLRSKTVEDMGALTEELLELDDETLGARIPSDKSRADVEQISAVLQTRREAAKSSVKKLNALTRAACKDQRVRGMLQFYGAGRTGRWAGRIFQPQNLPRPKFKTVNDCIKLILGGADIAGVEAFFGPVMSALSSCIRGCLIAKPGSVLMSVDYAQIEARVLAWLAGQQDILDIYASGADVYTYDAKQIGSDDRQLGKVCRLGLGYGMGPSRFVETALAYGLKLEASFAEQVVRGWRDNNNRIVNFWYELGRAVEWVLHQPVGAVLSVGTRLQVGTRTITSQRALYIKLPSGRDLVYLNAGFDGAEVSYDGMNQMTKKWERIRSWGGKFVENVVQAVARDLMVNGLLNVIDTPTLPAYPILSVHDEIVFETPEQGAKDTLKETIETMTRLPAWAAGLPLAAEGWVGPRYKK